MQDKKTDNLRIKIVFKHSQRCAIVTINSAFWFLRGNEGEVDLGYRGGGALGGVEGE